MTQASGMYPTLIAVTGFVLKLLALLPAVAGGVLFVRGWRAPRTPEKSACRRCGQDLSDRSGNHCPKCSLLLMPGDIIHGSRDRDLRILLAASLLVVISVLGMALLI